MRFRFNPLQEVHCRERLLEISKMENIMLDNETANEIIKIGKGDMRKILNILESTNNSFRIVNLKTVYECTGLPSGDEINLIVKFLIKENFEKSFHFLNNCKIDKGFSVTDIILELVKVVRMNLKNNVTLKIKLLKWFAEIDYLANLGGNEKILISNILGIFSELRNVNWKYDF